MAKNDTFDSMLGVWLEDSESEKESTAEAETESNGESEDTVEEDGNMESVGEEPENVSEDTDEESESEGTETVTEGEEDLSDTAEDGEDEKNDTSASTKAEEAMKADLEAYNKLFPNEKVERLEDIPNVMDFVKMRVGGMTVEEAAHYTRLANKADKTNGKEHIRASAPKKAAGAGIEGMSDDEYRMARSVLGEDMSDKEIADLFRRTRSK